VLGARDVVVQLFARAIMLIAGVALLGLVMQNMTDILGD